MIRLPGALLAILVASWLSPGQARAQCAPPDPLNPLVVECTGADPDGFDAGADDGVTLTVRGGATVSNGGSTDTIRLNDASAIAIEAGSEVTNAAAGGAAASVGDAGVVSHSGTIRVSGDGGVGIAGQDGNSLSTTFGSLIELQAPGTTGIRAGDSSISVSNDGEITGAAAGSFGIRVGSSNAVSNTGLITLDGAASTGVEVMGTDNAVNNVGSITLGGDASTGLAATGDDNTVSNSGSIALGGAASTGVALTGDDNGLSNTGSLSLTGDGSTGVALAGSGNTLSQLGIVSVTGANAVGVLAGVGGGEGNVVINAGSIAVGAGGGPAVSFAPSGPGDPDIANVLDARFGSTIDGGGGTAVLGSEGEEVLVTSGQILGSVDLAGGSDTLQLLDGGVMNGSVGLGTGDDTFDLFEGGVFTSVDGGAGIDAFLLRAGPLVSDSVDLSTVGGFETLELVSGDWTLRGAATFGNGITLTNGVARIAEPVSLAGGLRVAADAMAGTSGRLQVSDTLTLTGDYLQDAGSTLTAVLDPGGPSGSIAVIGAATLQAGAALAIVEAAPLAAGSFTILTASAGVTGDFPDPAPTAVLTFDVNNVMGQAIVLDVLRSPYASAAFTPNQVAVGAALDGVQAVGATGDLQALLSSLDGVGAGGAYGAALDTLHAEAYDAQTSAMLGFGYSFARLAARNLLECPPTYSPHLPTWIKEGPPCNEDGWTPWIGGFGSFGDREGGSGHIDYSGQGGGFAIGAGRAFGESWEVSGYAGGGFGSLEVTGVGDGSLQSFDVGVGAVRTAGAFSVRGVIGYGHGWHEQDRAVVLDGYLRNPTGSFQSNRVTGLLEADYDLVPVGASVLEPVASVDFTWLDEEGFQESGGQGANLAVESRSQTALSTTLGVRMVRTFLKGRYATDWVQWANGTWRPELDVRWRANWTDVDRDITARFVDAPAGTGGFTVQAEDAGQGAELAIGTTWQPYKTRILVSAGYRAFIGDGSQLHTVGAGVRVPL